MRVVARKGGVEVADEIASLYQMAKWDKAAKLDLREIGRKDGVLTVEARLFDAKGVQLPRLQAARPLRPRRRRPVAR